MSNPHSGTPRVTWAPSSVISGPTCPPPQGSVSFGDPSPTHSSTQYLRHIGLSPGPRAQALRAVSSKMKGDTGTSSALPRSQLPPGWPCPPSSSQSPAPHLPTAGAPAPCPQGSVTEPPDCRRLAPPPLLPLPLHLDMTLPPHSK